MAAVVFSLPRIENRPRVLGATGFISLLIHGFILGGLFFSVPLAVKKVQDDRGISIELETFQNPAKQVVAETSPIIPEPEEAREPQQKHVEISEPAPAPKPVPKKTETPKIKPLPKMTVASKQFATAKTQPGNKTLSGEPEVKKELPHAATFPPTPLGGASTPKPPYPELARRRGQEGTVHVRCQVDANGLVADASLARSSGHKLLDEAALNTVRKWKFRPGSSNGASVAGVVVVPVQFRLQ